MSQSAPLNDLIESIRKLQTKSKVSAPDVSRKAGKLLEVLMKGQVETGKNHYKRLHELEKRIAMLIICVDRGVDMACRYQKTYIATVQGTLGDLRKILEREEMTEDGKYPLKYFDDTEDSGFDALIMPFWQAINGLESLLCPEIYPTTLRPIKLNFSDSELDGAPGRGAALVAKRAIANSRR